MPPAERREVVACPCSCSSVAKLAAACVTIKPLARKCLRNGERHVAERARVPDRNTRGFKGIGVPHILSLRVFLVTGQTGKPSRQLCPTQLSTPYACPASPAALSQWTLKCLKQEHSWVQKDWTCPNPLPKSLADQRAIKQAV